MFEGIIKFVSSCAEMIIIIIIIIFINCNWVVTRWHYYKRVLLNWLLVVLQNNFTTSTQILCTNFNVFNNPSVFCIVFIDVRKLLKDDKDISKRVGVIKNCL